MTSSLNWSSWNNSSIEEYVMVDFEFKNDGTGGYQMLFQIGGSGSSAKDISPQWSVIFNASNANWLRAATKKINITGNSMTVSQQSWVTGDTHIDTGMIASGSAQGNRPGAGIESNTTFNNTTTTYKIKIIWEARLPAKYTSSNATAAGARGSPGLDTTEMYLYVDSGSGYVLDTFSPYYSQSWSYGLGAHYPPAQGWGGETSKRSLVGLGPNAVSSNFSIGYINGGSSSYYLKSGTSVKPVQFCKIKKKSGGNGYSPGTSIF